jgi:DNA-binding CsgD family transcriptional regulator
VLRGRVREQAVLAGLLDAARDGRSGALVLRGEAGVGKTALLDDLVTAAAEARVARVAGVEAERELPFAALHQLCGPFLGLLDRLPEPQRDALGVTFGLREGIAPNPLFVGLAVLTLLAEAAGDGPLLCAVDDAQWLDHASAQTLTFVARRLAAESVVMVFAVREPAGGTGQLTGLPTLRVDGLGDQDARALLASVVRWPLDEVVREAILAEARGNPLALLELPSGLSPVSLAGGYALPEALPLSGRIEETFRRRTEELSAGARLLLLLAAADPVGDAGVLWRAAERLGIPREAGDDLERAGLLRIGTRALFRHTLVRSAVYGTAPPEQKALVHRALADTTDRQTDPDRYAWHRSQAAAEPDDQIAAELAASAGRAQARGGLAASAAFLERSAELTVEPARRAAREIDAARATFQAGSPEAALRLLARAGAGPEDDLHAARIILLRGQMAFASTDNDGATALLLEAATRFVHLDIARVREILLEALAAAALAGRFAGPTGLPDVAAAVRALPRAHPGPHPLDGLVDALAVLYLDGFAAGVPAIRAALAGLTPDDLVAEDAIHWPYMVCHAANTAWDDAAWDSFTSAYLRLARGTGEISGLSYVLYQRVGVHLHQGELAQVADLVDEVAAIGALTGRMQPHLADLVLAGWRGREDEVTRLSATVVAGVTARREGAVLTVVELATAVLRNGQSRFAEARDLGVRATALGLETGFANWALAELIEAAAGCGDRPVAVAAFERLAERTRASGTEWALGVEACSRALITDGAEAEPHFREAVERLSRSRGALPLARAQLLYGEWLRSHGRLPEAKDALLTAYEMFRSFGTEGFAERAHRGLVASGSATARPAAGPTSAELTPQERQIARRARDGQSNAEIGAELFLSARTIEWHLRKVFSKLGISNRRELRTALAAPGGRPGGQARAADGR